MKYRCKHCNYRFSPKSDRQPARCPYCARADSLTIDSSS